MNPYEGLSPTVSDFLRSFRVLSTCFTNVSSWGVTLRRFLFHNSFYKCLPSLEWTPRSRDRLVFPFLCSPEGSPYSYHSDTVPTETHHTVSGSPFSSRKYPTLPSRAPQSWVCLTLPLGTAVYRRILHNFRHPSIPVEELLHQKYTTVSECYHVNYRHVVRYLTISDLSYSIHKNVTPSVYVFQSEVYITPYPDVFP